jgi:hypothetical protein
LHAACYLTWHVRRQLAELTYTDQAPPARPPPATTRSLPPPRSAHAQRKANRQRDDTGAPLHSFRGLLEHMATLTRNTITVGQVTFDKITLPTPTQRRAFELIGAPIPVALK